ncbi:hypothetical protein MBLNU457_5565t2 [Dothideomycetes sp. NU457]
MHVSSVAIAFTCASVVSAFVQGNCTVTDPSLRWLANRLSPQAAIACRGEPLQLKNAGRYWGEQYGKNASVVVYPITKEDVSYAVQASNRSPLGRDFAFVCGAHSMTGASSATGIIIDLSWMNTTEILHNVTVGDTTIGTAVAYQGGATWGGVNNATYGSGYCAVGARVSNVGAGGFSTGGGIGFLAGTYGYSIDRLRAMEVVLMSGQIICATKTNQYSDLFFALQGGGGQFGIVTKFYQEAAREPLVSEISIWTVANSSVEQAKQNTVDWFNNNDDPYSLMYYALAYVPQNLVAGPYGIQNVLVGLRFGNPTNTDQKDFNATFAPLLANLEIASQASYSLPYAFLTDALDGFFPYGFRRGFYGPQTTNISVDYLSKISATYDSYIASQLSKGDPVPTALWALQYMYPGLNGNLPPSDSATAWPHSVAGHQTLFSPAWNLPSDDSIVDNATMVFNQITHDQQKKVGPVLADYPNYISPGDTGRLVYGDNIERLIQIKAKYDPHCRIHNGRVFASPACLRQGKANLFA